MKKNANYFKRGFLKESSKYRSVSNSVSDFLNYKAWRDLQILSIARIDNIPRNYQNSNFIIESKV